jgi:hypothetical protein
VCSVFGQAPDMAACYAALVAGARSIEEELDGAGGGGRDDE